MFKNRKEKHYEDEDLKVRKIEEVVMKVESANVNLSRLIL